MIDSRVKNDMAHHVLAEQSGIPNYYTAESHNNLNQMFHSYLRLCRFSILRGASRLLRNSYHGNSSSKETNWPELCLKRSVVGSFRKYLRFYEMTYILKLKMISGLKVHKIITPGRKVRLKECCQLPRGDSTHNNFE